MPLPFNSPYSDGVSYTAVPITPSNTVDLVQPVRVVDVNTGGTVSFIDANGEAVSLTVTDGYSIKCIVKRINVTGTSASGFIGYP